MVVDGGPVEARYILMISIVDVGRGRGLGEECLEGVEVAELGCEMEWWE